MEWSARVHKTGSQVQILRDGKVAKVIKSAADTFKPEDAQAYATRLVATLNGQGKAAKQMTDTGAKPTVATPAETQDASLAAASKDAKGTDAQGKTASLENENAALRRKIARMEKESAIERKARRGLAIVKELVAQGKMASDESMIKSELMKITAMANDEITLLERKTAGLPLYESKEEAATEHRRYARLSRLHKQAADDAQLAGDIKTADAEDLRADHYAALSEQAKKFAYSTDGEYAPFKSDAAPSKKEDAVNQAEDEPKGKDAEGNLPKHAAQAQAIYMKIATDHEELAKLAEASGDLKKAQTEREIAKEAKELAAMFEGQPKEACGMDNAPAVQTADAEDGAKTAESEGSKEAAKDEKGEAKEDGKEKEAAAEAATKEAAKDEKDEAKDEAKEDGKEAAAEATAKEATAETKEAAADGVDHKSAAEAYRKIAALHRKRADEFESKGETDKADLEDRMAMSAEDMANEHESMFKKEGEPAAAPAPAPALAGDPAPMPEKGMGEAAPALDAAPALENQVTNEETHLDDELDATNLWNHDESSNAAAEAEPAAHDDGVMPTDDEITAAMHYSNGLEESMDGIGESDDDKVATRKLDSVKTASADRAEENPAANDPSVRGLEDLWRKG